MFVLLSNEASKWAYTMKGNVKYEFHAMLNNYLTASSRLERYCNNFINMDKVEDVAEVMSRMVEMLTSENREEFLSYMIAYFNGQVKVIKDDQGE